MEAAEISIVNWKREHVYKTKVQHAPGSFRVNKYAKNGFNSHSLEDGKPAAVIREELQELLIGKLLTGIALGGDLDSIGLAPFGFDSFELQGHWYVFL